MYFETTMQNLNLTYYKFLALNLCAMASDCSHGCNNSPNGFVCLCPENMTLQNDRITCSTCDTWGHCSQKCIKAGKNKHKCTCNDGYLLAADHFTCKSIGIFFIFNYFYIIKFIFNY